MLQFNMNFGFFVCASKPDTLKVLTDLYEIRQKKEKPPQAEKSAWHLLSIFAIVLLVVFFVIRYLYNNS